MANRLGRGISLLAGAMVGEKEEAGFPLSRE
jgi:hypothetical protein